MFMKRFTLDEAAMELDGVLRVSFHELHLNFIFYGGITKKHGNIMKVIIRVLWRIIYTSISY